MITSHPVWVRGLKRSVQPIHAKAIVSHPVWVRGLKLLVLFPAASVLTSHPVWVRGLKHFPIEKNDSNRYVAPRVGAWIET